MAVDLSKVTSKTLDDATLHMFIFLIRSMFSNEETDIIEYWFQSIVD